MSKEPEKSDIQWVSPDIAYQGGYVPPSGIARPKRTFEQFQNPDSLYRPFVRWWWNGDKVNADELKRELNLMKVAGIGGVEINPIAFPSSRADDMGIPSLTWLSPEWIDMIKVVFDEAKRLDMTCDLLIGSGWPFGMENLKGDEQAQAVFVYAQKVEGPTHFTITEDEIFKAIDPEVSDPNPDRKFEVMQLQYVPEPMYDITVVTDLPDQVGHKDIVADIPEGTHWFYATVRIQAFASVINGAPGASGTMLNHYNGAAVRKFLDNMSSTIEKRIGPLSQYIRAVFTDSLELEGSNWSSDMDFHFKVRYGYDLKRYLPYLLYKVGRLGDVQDENYGVPKTDDFKKELTRVRFDFEQVRAEMLFNNFTTTCMQWARDNGFLTRAQAYGRGFFPLESSLLIDIPEGESWTTNWLKHRLGEEMGDFDYRRGRGYTMINKYVSSACHLQGKREMSCEEMTNTYTVFNTTLEFLKIGSDMSAISGVTHSVWHGFNYSPPNAPYPGWVMYGTWHNEKNIWWKYAKLLNDYKARLSSQLKNMDMYTDIAILTPIYDMWGEMGVQTEPFPVRLNIPYTSLVWEAIHKHGGGADYITEIILRDAEIKGNKLVYNNKEYSVIFLVAIKGIFPPSMHKLYDFLNAGGTVICINNPPSKSLQLMDKASNDNYVKNWLKDMEWFTDRFLVEPEPYDDHFMEWYSDLQKRVALPAYLTIETPDRYLMQNRYRDDDGNEVFLFANVHLHEPRASRIVFKPEISKGRYPWIWDINTGKRYRIELDSQGGFQLNLGPAESLLIVFDGNAQGEAWNPLPKTGSNYLNISERWDVEFHHFVDPAYGVKTMHMNELTDLLKTNYAQFCGTAVYKKTLPWKFTPKYLNLGKVWNVCEVYINGKQLETKWFGNRIYDISPYLNDYDSGNLIEVHVITTMGNYFKTMPDNKCFYTFLLNGTHFQEDKSMGLVGPVTVYDDPAK